jgi:hypothetical protein
VRGDGSLCEAFVFGGANEQQRRLEADGILVINNKVNLKKYGLF